MSLTGRAVQWFAVTSLTYPLGIIYSVILARGLGPDARGEYAVFLSMGSLLCGILSLGLGVVGRAEIAQNPSRFAHMNFQLLRYALLVGLALLGLVFSVPKLLAAIVRLPDERLLFAVALVVPLLIYSGYWQLLSQGAGWYRAINMVRIVRSLEEPALLAGFFLVFGKSALSAAGTWLFSNFLIACVCVVLARRLGGSAKPGEKQILGRMASRGWRLMLSMQAIGIQMQGAVLLLNYFWPGKEVGYFAIANALALQIGIVFGTVTAVVSDRIAATDKGASERLVLFLNRFLLWGSLPVLLGSLALGTWVITLLYGVPYRPAGGILWILAVGGAISAISEINCQYLIGQHRETGLILKLSLVNCVIGLGLCVLLIPSYGAYGAAAGVSIGYIANTVAYQIVVRRRMSCRWRDLMLLSREDLGTIQIAVRQMQVRGARA